MTLTDVSELSVCTDCLMFIANGETPDEMDETETAGYVAAVDHYLQGMLTFPGSTHEHCTHGRDEDCPEDEGHFSHRSCDACRRPLGGMRYPACALAA